MSCAAWPSCTPSGRTPLTCVRAQLARQRAGSREFLRQHWADHEPGAPYDAITCIEATEHFASAALSPDEKVEVYRGFFDRAASWLRPGGRMGLQLICLDNVGHAGSRAGRGPFSDL